MPKLKDGFLGEQSIILPPMIVDIEERDPLVSSLYITDIGFYPMAEHHYRSRKNGIDQYVLIYCVDGKGWYRVGDKEYQVERNQYFILPAGVPHSYGSCEGQRWTIYWVHFKGAHAAIYAEGAQKPQTIGVAINSHISERNNIFDEILNTLRAGNEIEDLRYASSLLHYYLASMRYLQQWRRAPQLVDIVEAAIHYMEENIERRITLQDVTHYVGFSMSYFSAQFKRKTGVSPLAYFNRLKIRHACQLLEGTDLHVNQICYKLGFEDSLYFSRLFSKIMGVSPTTYRQQNKPIQQNQTKNNQDEKEHL